jgi:opacity protein-like surface antigen
MQLTLRNTVLVLLAAAALALAWFFTSASRAEAGSFTGCNVGALGSWNSANVEDVFGAEGPGIAATAGCDFNLGNSPLVVGAWGEYGFRRFDFAGTDIDSKGWAAGGRAGVVVHQHTLIYGSVGWTQVDAEAFGGSLDLSGAVYGGGVETNLGGGLYAVAEYQRLQLEPDDFDDVTAYVNSFRAGLKWRFGGPQEVIQAVDAPFTAPKPAPLK